MTDRMRHRGPDDGGLRLDGPVAIGARRLSVIDVAGGHQPVGNEDGTVWAALNGEIYNYPRLREDLLSRGHRLTSHCDTEALVHLYEDFGPGLVHALEGMFAFVIWDRRRSELLLGRDRFGEKPLFYDTRGGELSFASELSALRAGRPGGTLDPLAMESLLALGYVAGPRTLYEGIHQLPAGHVLRWPLVARRAVLTRYWQMPAPAAPDAGAASIEVLTDEAEDLLDRSVRSRLVADVPVGVLLSGGLDSTLVAALARRHTAHLSTFTVAYDTGDVGEDGVARLTAERLGSDHHELRMTSAWVSDHVPAMLAGIDQPIADPAAVALTAISRLAREHVTVAVGGEGADELFFGYPRYRWLTRAQRMGQVLPVRPAAHAATLARRAGGTGRGRRVAELLQPVSAVERNLRWISDGRLDARPGLYGSRLDEQAQRGDLQAALRDGWEGTLDAAAAASRLDQGLYLCDDILQKADRASMSASLEMRTPYLDRTLAEFATTVPASVHMAGGGKNLLRRVLRRTLPEAGSGQKKTAFRVPLADWLRGPLAAHTATHVLGGRLVDDGWVTQAGGAALVGRLTAGYDAAARDLWPLLCAGVWLDGLP